METILDLEGTAILSTACTFSLTSINVRKDFFPPGRNAHNTHCENFDTLLGPEPNITGPISTREINTTLPEIGGWITGGNSPTTPELGTWTTIGANSTAKADNWSPTFTELDLYEGNISPTETADTEDGYQEMCLASLQQETSYSKSHNVRVIKHKPSAITFTDLPLDVICDSASYDNDTQEDKESDDDTEEEDENEDVFTDLPRYKYTFTGIKRRSSHPRSPQKTFTDSKEIFQMFDKKYRNNGSDLGEEERKTSTDAGSPWSQSMTCLMMKLEQLNVDIDGAISASSIPPCFSYEESEEQVPPETLNYTVAELEAKEACEWLRAAGFPQYAQLYEDSQFPIDIASVKRDHDFLDRDHVEPLCRRLNTLNKCASMKLDVSLQRKKSEDSDEEDHCAISDKWTFQRFSRRWSRVDDIDTLLGRSERLGSSGDMKNTTSSESVLTDLSEPEICSIHSGSSGGSDCRCASGETFECNDTMCVSDPNSVNFLPPYWPRDISDGKFYAKTDKSSHTKAKTLLKCMGTLRGKGAHGKLKGPPKTGGLIISEPILQLEPESVKSLNCVQIGNGPVSDSAMDFKVTGNLDSKLQMQTIDESTSSMKDAEASESNKRAGMYLEDIDLFTMTGIRAKPSQNHKNEFHSQEDLVVHIPKDHKPGTFPKAISIESLSPTDNLGGVNWRGASISLSGQKALCVKEPRPLSSRCPRGSRLSVYDNVPGSHLYASTGDLMDLEKDDLFPHLDDVLQHINGLQQSVDHWSKDVMPELQDDNLSFQIPIPTFRTPNPVALDFEGNSISDGRTTPSDLERDAASLNESDATGTRERRDSGVGASLTRTNRHLRWHSFQVSHQLSGSLASLQISNQSAGQLNLLQKFSLLRLTAIMEKYSMSNKHGWTWSVPKFMKRMKGPDYKDKNVFGVPLMVHVQRTGQPMPQSIQQALRFLRSNCLDQVGLFRKSGVKSRIQALRQMNENSPENVNYEGQCAYDVADMIKQFFRDLPEPLLTSKLGETFLHIYQYVPKDQRLQAVQSAIMLMSDENREVLQTLLCFLNDVTSVEENQMTPMNLAVCLAPSLFHLNLLKRDNSPRAIQKKYATGKPDQKDLNENLAATQGLAHMIMESNKLFEIPEEIIAQSRNSYAEVDIHAPTMEELVKQMEEEAESVCKYFDNVIQNLQKESKDKFKGWVSLSSTENTDLTYKKVGDGNPLRLWKVSVEVEAPPSVVLNRLLRERHLWDEDFAQAKVIETIDNQTEVYQYLVDSMAPHPSKDFVVLRTWRTDLPKGMCSLVATSVEHEEAPVIGGVRAIVLETRYLIEPCGSGKSRLTYICRVDLKGHCLDWYNKCFGHICAVEALRMRNSFQPLTAEGPETKI